MTQPTRWIQAATLDEVPEDGSGHRFNLDGLDVAIFNWDQSFFALENSCPHLGFPLTEGIVQDGMVICGWHGWRVQLDNGGCRGRSIVTRSYPCEVRGEEVWVEIPERIEPAAAAEDES